MESPETTPAPEPLPAKKREICWHRVRVYLYSILLIASMWVCGVVISIREHPERFVAKLLEQLPYESSFGNVKWMNRRTLKIEDLKVGGFFYADAITITTSPFGLWRRHVAKVRIDGGQVFTKPLYQAMEQTPVSPHSQGLDWVIGTIEISRSTVMLNNLIEDVGIPVRLGVKQPLTIHGLRLGAPDESPDMFVERTADLGPIFIVSPLDPVAPVMSFPLVRLRYTYSEIWRHKIRGVDLVRPTLFVGEDLFWFTKQFQKEHQNAPVAGPEAPWVVKHFGVAYGQLAVNAFGQPVVELPFFFGTEVNDIRLDQLDKISAKSVIAIKRLDRNYPDYKIRLVDLEGRLYFSLPITDESANNVVNTITVKKLYWNDIPVENASSTVTFDSEGVYGKVQGKCEGGQMTGNFEFYYSKNFEWNADFFANKINLQPIAQKLGGKYVDLTGELDGKLDVEGKATEILKCEGTLSLPRPGTLVIKSLDDLLKKLPEAGQLSFKDQALKLAVNNFREYPYQSGQLKVGYTPAGGSGVLSLDSEEGKRQFGIYWHPYTSSKVANDGDNQ